ncbi:major facilitator superfamily domain-containing protein [Crepidotus variabilis]|uniref:Major facilitator superfamily domain-containing protein n=1 Tax=Crepidotus variabilis TaxID=179855 RepID=A0A9P6EEC8_9AGAR|nr:major facilitator superfamily domain-containing protein [Crepidotus variabilis]
MEKEETNTLSEKEATSLTSNEPLSKLPAFGSPERAAAEKSLRRKLDLRLMPTLFFIIILNYIDRNAVTSARLQGLQTDLNLTDVQWASVIAIMYVTFCPAQIPSNMILNKISRPSLYIGTCTVLWGMVSSLTGITKSFPGILLARLFLGLPEAAFYPGSMFLLSRWYTKKELAFRMALIYSGTLISNAFGSLMAAGILAGMDGARGIRAWRWLFFIEGAVTICFGFNAMWLLPDYPHNTRWLSKDELHLAQARLADDAGEADQDDAGDSPLAGLTMALKDPKVLLFMLMTLCSILGCSFNQFFPTLTKTLGYNTTITLILAAPPWIFAAIICCANAWHADRTGERFFHFSFWLWCVLIGFIIAMSTMVMAARYISLFLMALGYVGATINLVWVANVIARPPAKRAAAIALCNGFGNMGFVAGSYIWQSSWGPEYRKSMGICFASIVTCTTVAFVIRQLLNRENKKLDADELAALGSANRARVEEAARLEGITLEQAMERRKGFRYLS